MEESRDDLVHEGPGVAGAHRSQRLVVVAERVHVEVPWGREQEGEHVGQRHRHEHGVGGGVHVSFAEHYDDQSVGDYRDKQQERHHVSRVQDKCKYFYP